MKSRGPSSSIRRRTWCRPQLLTLEDRLPPGDAVLGAALGAALAGPSLAAGHATAAAAAGAGTVAPVAVADSGQGSAEQAPDAAFVDVVLAPFPAERGQPGGGASPLAGSLRVRGGTRPATALADGPLAARHGNGAVSGGEAAGPVPAAGSAASPGRAPDDRGVAGLPAAPEPAGSRRLPELALWAGLAAAGSPAGAGPLRFDPAAGLLAIHDGGGDAVHEGVDAAGFLVVGVAGRGHSSDPCSTAFDPALAGAGRASLRTIHLEGGGQTTLVLDGQALAGGLTVSADGPVTVAGEVAAAGDLAVAAPVVTVRGRLQAPAVDLASSGLLNVAAGAVVSAGWQGSGGRLSLSAGVLVNAGQVDADGGSGGAVVVQAGNVLNAGRVTADGAAAGGAVTVGFSGSYLDTAAALTSASGGRGGQVTVDGGRRGSCSAAARTGPAGWPPAGPWPWAAGPWPWSGPRPTPRAPPAARSPSAPPRRLRG
jgi:hypothetical protein